MSSPPTVHEITAVVRSHLGPRARCVEVSRSLVGNSQETYFIQIDGIEGEADAVELVLRRSAAGGTLEWSERGIEVSVLAAAHQAGLPVPRVWWWEPDGSALERSYTVMDRSPGANPDLRDAAVCDVLAADLGRQLARLHLMAKQPAQLPHPGDAAAASRTHLDWWVSRARSNPMTTEVAASLCGWLTAHLPNDGATPVLLWGDPGPHNVLTDSRGTITALLDWELAHIGHPLLDLGATRWACLGQLDRELVTRSYERETGRPVDRTTLAWFEVLACVTRSIMLFDGLASSAKGRTHDPNVLALGLVLVNANMIRAAHIAWGISIANVSMIDVGPRLDRPSPSELQRAVARFLDLDVRAVVDDPRVRRGLKIAAALLQTLATTETDNVASPDPWVYFELEASGASSIDTRRRLVAGLARDRAGFEPLPALYGATVSIS